MVSVSFYGTLSDNNPHNSMEIMVENIVREHPLTTIDFIILMGLLSIVIYCFSYIRRHK
jgi:hypothetical protein